MGGFRRLPRNDKTAAHEKAAIILVARFNQIGSATLSPTASQVMVSRQGGLIALWIFVRSDRCRSCSDMQLCNCYLLVSSWSSVPTKAEVQPAPYPSGRSYKIFLRAPRTGRRPFGQISFSARSPVVIISSKMMQLSLSCASGRSGEHLLFLCRGNMRDIEGARWKGQGHTRERITTLRCWVVLV